MSIFLRYITYCRILIAIITKNTIFSRLNLGIPQLKETLGQSPELTTEITFLHGFCLFEKLKANTVNPDQTAVQQSDLGSQCLLFCKHILLCLHMSRHMRFPTMWYLRPAKPQISLRVHPV